ncbi:DUF1553 domain-containing protein [Paludisphaera rhizosphaerae]|uniref:DUF1553 domain-containing protein n=1 Tax=Paludisphaera rhizosphaerae TaxID=2711216 RepID=UPI0013EBB258|nr:DUF1553 domain-containing protein [Paludisphaera rhizosphaerae]
MTPPSPRTRTRSFVLVLACLVLAGAGPDDAPPAFLWTFDAEESTRLEPHGGVHRDVPGPRPPTYPDFAPDNTAVKLDGRGAYFSFDDPGPGSPLDFAKGDAITLEAWVQVDELNRGEAAYVVGKGRTGAPGFPADNQSWALRVREGGGRACVNFLFASPKRPGTAGDAHWHRWTSKNGFTPGKGWHHLAVTYRFGDAASIRAWIDGVPREGVWDMGGATDEGPVVDDAPVWIGSSMGGAASASFRGALDSVAVHRRAFDDAAIKSRYQRVGEDLADKPAPEVAPEVGPIPAGRVLVTLYEGMPAHQRWFLQGETPPGESARFTADSFLIDRLPHGYDDWGVRRAWKAPVLVRMAADVDPGAGSRRLLARVRGLSRLWVDGVVVARGAAMTGSPNGEEPITPPAEPPHPGLRPAEHRQQEITAVVELAPDRAHRVVLEAIIGGKTLKPDPGETCVAVESEKGRTYHVLTPVGASPVELTDADVEPALARLEASLRELEDMTRRAQAMNREPYWNKRREAARAWLAAHPGSEPPAAGHPIDAFLDARIKKARERAAKDVGDGGRFQAKILPILRERCQRCHGEKSKGGLKLDSLAAALQGGESGEPALVPGDPDSGELLRRLRTDDAEERMPPGAEAMPDAEIQALADWVRDGASWPAPPVAEEALTPPPALDDAAFLRRLTLDVVGVSPTEAEVRAFLADASPDKRMRAVDRLLADPRWAGGWMGYWQDVLAENPTLINASLNTTGPFRWFLYESLRDDKPIDRMVAELIQLRGSSADGGAAGFGLAGDNDAPFAAKGQIVASAFLGVELQCARCHDSPYHSTTQRDLYSLAAMFAGKPVIVPKTSRVPAGFFEKKARESLIKVTLKPDEPIAAEWPFDDLVAASEALAAAPVEDPKDARERLAALVTSPADARFARVTVNRVWRRYLGAGIVEPPDDWEGRVPSHPEMLDWLARRFVGDGYSLKALARLILTSDVYQRRATGANRNAPPESRFFAAPDRRRLSAEQVVDSLFAAAGRPMDLEELTFDPDGRRTNGERVSLGRPERAWMLANLANERDRPSLALPNATAVADVMEAFGWTGARQNPRTDRDASPNVLQPGALGNGVAATRLTRVAAGGGLAELALAASSPGGLVDSVFLRCLGRFPTDVERAPLTSALADGFADRRTPANEIRPIQPPPALPAVTWSNHLRSEANLAVLELERRTRSGPPVDPRLRDAWRERFEDVVWSVVNLPEFVWSP